MQELAEELGIYLLFFDRAGYGDSDANPGRTLKDDATDVEQLADALQLGDKFYVVGCSMGGYTAWGCLHYIPHRSGITCICVRIWSIVLGVLKRTVAAGWPEWRWSCRR